MWVRTVEVCLAIWLALSPVILVDHPGGRWTAIDLLTATAIATLALLSFWHRTRYAHLGILVPAAAMMLHGRFLAGDPMQALAQNHLVLGLLLAMFAIIPTRVVLPPLPWSGDHPC